MVFISAFRSELAGIRRRAAGVRRAALPEPAAAADQAAPAPPRIPPAPSGSEDGGRRAVAIGAWGADAIPAAAFAGDAQRDPYSAWIGTLGGRRIAMLAGGMGARAAFRAAFRACVAMRGLAGDPPPSPLRDPAAVVSVGFCGGLDETLRRGDVLVPSRIVSPDGSWECSRKLIEAAVAAAETGAASGRKRGFRILSGTLYCSPTIVRTAAEKRALADAAGADAVDMESAGVAAFCARAGIPAAAVKVVLDGAGEELPKGLEELMDSVGRIRPARLAARLLGNPAFIADMIAMRRQAASCAENLGAAVESLSASI